MAVLVEWASGYRPQLSYRERPYGDTPGALALQETLPYPSFPRKRESTDFSRRGLLGAKPRRAAATRSEPVLDFRRESGLCLIS